MILLIFEGAHYEPLLYENIKSLFFPKNRDHIICSFCNSIYTFYKRLKNDYNGYADTVKVLQNERRKIDGQDEILKYRSSDFESIYIFFDYDFYSGDLQTKNSQVKELLEYFNEETENGKLFVSYPMIESIQYTKELPNSLFYTYTVSRNKSIGKIFKMTARKFCYYKGYDYLKNLDNWKFIIWQNVVKANWLTKNILSWQLEKDNVDQLPIFEAQLKNYVLPQEEVAILNAFPLFLSDYFPKYTFVVD